MSLAFLLYVPFHYIPDPSPYHSLLDNLQRSSLILIVKSPNHQQRHLCLPGNIDANSHFGADHPLKYVLILLFSRPDITQAFNTWEHTAMPGLLMERESKTMSQSKINIASHLTVTSTYPKHKPLFPGDINYYLTLIILHYAAIGYKDDESCAHCEVVIDKFHCTSVINSSYFSCLPHMFLGTQNNIQPLWYVTDSVMILC